MASPAVPLPCNRCNAQRPDLGFCIRHPHGCRIGFGDQYRWLEIDSAELIEVGHLYSQSASEFTHDASHNVTVHQMEDKGGGLFECLSEMGTLIFIPEKGQAEKNEVLRVIYRPIVKR